MAAVAAIVLPDAQATPVNHTFTPLGPDSNGVWWFEDQSAVSAIGNQRVAISLTRPKPATTGNNSSERMIRCKMSIYMPTLETLSNNASGLTPAPTIAYVERANVEFLHPERSTLQNRKDARKYLLGLLANALVVDAVENLVGVY